MKPIRLLLLPVLATSIGAAGVPRPVVVELFQSQGCSSCPPALAVLARLADRPGVIALSFAVTYWDQLGWKDGFATPAYTARQWDYARHNARAQVATPQMWIDGRTTIVGGDPAQANQAIDAAPAMSGPAVTVAGSVATVAGGASPAGGADVWLVRYDPRTIQVAIRAGENGGRMLAHRNIVRQLLKLGRWAGVPERYALPAAAQPGWRSAVLVQGGAGGPILSAAQS